MLKGISPLISPELLAELSRMGHGDEIILADAHFPGNTYNSKVIRADGLLIPDLLEAILPLFELDSYVEHPLVMMAAVEGDNLDPKVEENWAAEGGRIGFKTGGDSRWIQKASASIKKRGTEGKCTPITKKGCTGKAKALGIGSSAM